jgi:uncharacterized damage-inducible protein DinB/predicted RNase H-like HicB family nuclease
MTTYDLSLESGPKRRTTMVHVFGLLGCIANGPTTGEALASTPEAIRAYLHFLWRHGEPVDPDAAFETPVAEHITEGEWLGNGSPYIVFARDFEPVSDAELATYLARFRWMREDLAGWVRTCSDDELDAAPLPKGRAARAVLLHVIAVPGAYLSAALGGATGFSHLQTQAERGLVPLDEALIQVVDMVEQRIAQATPEDRARIVERPKDVRTFRKALRRMLEHDWEHLSELSRRPRGPIL